MEDVFRGGDEGLDRVDLPLGRRPKGRYRGSGDPRPEKPRVKFSNRHLDLGTVPGTVGE